MLAVFKPPADVGPSGAAYRLLEASLFVTWSVNAAVLPVLSRLSSESRPSVGFVFQRALKLVLAISLPMAVGAAVLAQPLITTLYGEQYRPAATALALLAPAILLFPVSSLSSALLYSQHRQRVVAYSYAAIVVQNVATNLVLIPRFSYNGAAASTLDFRAPDRRHVAGHLASPARAPPGAAAARGSGAGWRSGGCRDGGRSRLVACGAPPGRGDVRDGAARRRADRLPGRLRRSWLIPRSGARAINTPGAADDGPGTWPRLTGSALRRRPLWSWKAARRHWRPRDPWVGLDGACSRPSVRARPLLGTARPLSACRPPNRLPRPSRTPSPPA